MVDSCEIYLLLVYYIRLPIIILRRVRRCGMSHDLRLSDALLRLRLCQAEIDRQLKEVCTRRSVAKVINKRSRSLPCSLDTEPPPEWTCYEFGAGTSAFSKAFLQVTKGRGGVVTIDNDDNAHAHIEEDYTSFLCDGLDAAFTKRPPSVLLLCANCTSNSKLSVTSHRRCDEPVNGVPNTLDAARAISFANASNEAIWRIMLKALYANPLCILIIETPAGYIENQPVFYDKFLKAFSLQATRVCRCKLYETPHRKETIVLNNMACWPPNRMSVSSRMCSVSSPCQPLLDRKTNKHRQIACGSYAAQSAAFEQNMALDLARACYVELCGAHLC